LFIPGGEIAYSAFLSLLEEGGMNEMFRKVGEYFEWETLTVYDVSIVGFSYAAASNIHTWSENNVACCDSTVRASCEWFPRDFRDPVRQGRAPKVIGVGSKQRR
jgi:hypothetical protein